MEKSIHSAKIRLRADCGSDHELLICKFRLKLKKASKQQQRKSMDYLLFISTYYHLLRLDSLFLRCVAWVIFMCSLSHDEITYMSLFGLCTT